MSKSYVESGNPPDEPSIVQEMLSFIQLVATPKRPDGTYNYCREALEKKAKDILTNMKANKEFDPINWQI